MMCFISSFSPHKYRFDSLLWQAEETGFVCSSLIYDEDRIPFVVRGLIQLVICACVLLVGYFISGGIPDGVGFRTFGFIF